MTWKTFFLILILGILLVFVTMKSLAAQKRTFQSIAKTSFLVGCLQHGYTYQECKPLADKYVKEYVR